MSILSRYEDKMLDKYLDFQDCCGADDCEVSCHCDDHHEDEYEDSDEARWEDQEHNEVEPYDRW